MRATASPAPLGPLLITRTRAPARQSGCTDFFLPLPRFGGEGETETDHHNLILLPLLRPELAVERAVADGLDDVGGADVRRPLQVGDGTGHRSEEHTSELQSLRH